MRQFPTLAGLITAALSAAIICTGPSARAAPGGNSATPTRYYEQGLLVRSGETVEGLGPTLMGDALNEYSGGLEFTHTDVSLPGNNALPVAVGRHIRAGAKQTTLANGLFGDWDLDIPHLQTIASLGQGNWYGNGWTSPNLARCSQFQVPPIASTAAGGKSFNVSPYLFWDGYHMHIPGSGEQTLLGRVQAPGNPAVPPNATQPTDGLQYPVLTKQHWQISCLPSLENGGGEGFLAHAPDGTRYQFDHLVSRPALTFKAGTGVYLSRIEIWIMPTQITDRFGNWVRYSYGGPDGWQVQSITSSDGRSITFTYGTNGNRVQSVSDGTRTWSYAYNGSALQTVTLPDSSQWQFSLGDLERDPGSSPDPDCDYGSDPPPLLWDNYTRVGTVVHPSGAVGSFSMKMTLHGRSAAPGSDATCHTGTLVSRYFTNYALASKTLSGAGMPAMTWSYAYSAAVGSFAPCNGCVNTKTVSITDPLNHVTQNTYGTQFSLNEGLLLNSAEGVSAVSGGVALRQTAYTYQAPNAGPYPTRVGYNGGYADSMSVIHTPQSQRTLTQQGVSFSQTANAFDIYARATGLTRASSLGHSRSEATTYHDNTTLWMLGQVSSRTIAGALASSTSFNGSTALPSASYAFGKLQSSYSFHADGTLASVKDGLNQTTSFTNYKRGLPQNIGYADGSGISAVVNNIGTLASVTNEAGTSWSFGYDAMGRLASKTPPGGDNPTTLSFVQVPSDEYGIEANHWRQTITTGNAVTVNIFDARWRKRVSLSYDALDPANTQRMQRFKHDPYNRITNAAYPARSLPSIDSYAGTATTYDALGRITGTVSDSELGALSTSTAYLSGFVKRRTDAKGNVTTTAFQAFDEPDESAIASIAAPEVTDRHDRARQLRQAARDHPQRDEPGGQRHPPLRL